MTSAIDSSSMFEKHYQSKKQRASYSFSYISYVISWRGRWVIHLWLIYWVAAYATFRPLISFNCFFHLLWAILWMGCKWLIQLGAEQARKLRKYFLIALMCSAGPVQALKQFIPAYFCWMFVFQNKEVTLFRIAETYPALSYASIHLKWKLQCVGHREKAWFIWN